MREATGLAIKMKMTIADLVFDFFFEAQRNQGPVAQLVSGCIGSAMLITPGIFAMLQIALPHLGDERIELHGWPTVNGPYVSAVVTSLALSWIFLARSRRKLGIGVWAHAKRLTDSKIHRFLGSMAWLCLTVSLFYVSNRAPIVSLAISLAILFFPLPKDRSEPKA